MIRISCRLLGWSRSRSWRWPVRAGLHELAREHLSLPSDKGANAGLKVASLVASLVAGMVAGADSIDDMALLRHGGMGRVFRHAYAPSTLGSFLRAFTFGHVRQLDAVASRFLVGLAAQTPVAAAPREGHEVGARVMVDIDDNHHRDPRLHQAGLGLRLLRGPWAQRTARDGEHQGPRAGGRGPTLAQRVVRFPAGREASGR